MSDFAKKLIASNDDTMWRAGKTIEELEAKVAEQRSEYHNLWSAIRSAYPEMRSIPFEPKEATGYLDRTGSIRKDRRDKALKVLTEGLTVGGDGKGGGAHLNVHAAVQQELIHLLELGAK